MNLIFKKSDQEDLDLKIETSDGTLKDFDYIYLIKSLFNNENINNIQFPDDIEDEQKENMEQMIEKINEIIQKNTNSNNEESDEKVVED